MSATITNQNTGRTITVTDLTATDAIQRAVWNLSGTPVGTHPTDARNAARTIAAELPLLAAGRPASAGFTDATHLLSLDVDAPGVARR